MCQDVFRLTLHNDDCILFRKLPKLFPIYPTLSIGKKVDITDTGSGFDISFNSHFIRHWEKSPKIMNFNHVDYLEIARNSSLIRLDDNDIKTIAERDLEIYDKL